jgi:hypothetical protein
MFILSFQAHFLESSSTVSSLQFNFGSTIGESKNQDIVNGFARPGTSRMDVSMGYRGAMFYLPMI